MTGGQGSLRAEAFVVTVNGDNTTFLHKSPHENSVLVALVWPMIAVGVLLGRSRKRQFKKTRSQGKKRNQNHFVIFITLCAFAWPLCLRHLLNQVPVGLEIVRTSHAQVDTELTSAYSDAHGPGTRKLTSPPSSTWPCFWMLARPWQLRSQAIL
jgi:hypothetical protein